jgi:hypothetical protein
MSTRFFAHDFRGYKFERLTGKGKIGPHTDSLRLQLHYDQTHQQGYGGHSWSKDKNGYNLVDVQSIARLCVYNQFSLFSRASSNSLKEQLLEHITLHHW